MSEEYENIYCEHVGHGSIDTQSETEVGKIIEVDQEIPNKLIMFM